MAPVEQLLVRAKTIVTNASNVAQNRVTFDDLGAVRDGALLIREGKIAFAGTRAETEKRITGEVRELDFDGVIVPGFVDAHAHPLFAGNREPDFAARLRDEKPQLGMLFTVEQTRRALEHPDRFWDLVRPRLATIAAHGTTTLEVKTGYALHRPGETELLRLIDTHKDDAGLPRLIATFLGAHALPPEFTNEVDYVDYLVDQCLPVAKADGAVYADAFCEPGFFSPEQTRRYLEAARAHGLRLRVHCDEMAFGHAAQMASSLGVDAVDHCNYIRENDVDEIVRGGIVTVACPATIAYLGLGRSAPVRALLERGGNVALASDYNPGTSPCFNLQTVAYFGRAIFNLTAAEALYAVTRAAARSLRIDAGALRVGTNADFVVLGIESPEEFGWQFGGNLARAVFRSGRLVA